MSDGDEGRPVAERPDQVEQPSGLTTEQMIALLSQPAAAEFAYQVAQTYENVERVYNASLDIGTVSASAASTNTP